MRIYVLFLRLVQYDDEGFQFQHESEVKYPVLCLPLLQFEFLAALQVLALVQLLLLKDQVLERTLFVVFLPQQRLLVFLLLGFQFFVLVLTFFSP